MSNFLAIATVTASLRQALQEAVATDVAGASVTATRPEAARSGNQEPVVNLYLYQVTPNAALRNSDLPARGPEGQPRNRSRVALDLHYLVSFYGNEARLEPQRLMGSVLRTLHERAVITRSMIERALADRNNGFLAGSDLASEVELVKLTPASLSLEELSKLWSIFFQTPYALSVAYTGTVVLIDGLAAPRPALPVRTHRIHLGPFSRPTIEHVAPEGGADQPVQADSRLRILGSWVNGEALRARVGMAVLTPQQVGERQLLVDLASAPASSLRAGVQSVQLVPAAGPPAPDGAALTADSNAFPIVVRPTVVAVRASSSPSKAKPSLPPRVTVDLRPRVGKEQRVALLLRASSQGEALTYTLPALPRDGDGGTLDFSASQVRPGGYLVAVQVDGAESPLEVDTDPNSPTFERYIAPRLTVAPKPHGEREGD